jgi:hypothetical protein
LSGATAGRVAWIMAVLCAPPGAKALAEETTAAQPTCAVHEAQPIRVASVGERFDLLLDDGRLAALVGVEFDPDAPGRGAFSARLAGSDLRMRALAPNRDRWGRIPAAIFLAREKRDGADAGATNLAEAALAAGLGLYRPDALAHPCRDALLAAEARARVAKTGIWADSGRRIVDAADRRAVAAAGAGLAIVEGEVTGFGDSGGRVYLNFGKIRTVDLAIVISKRNIDMFDMQGLAPRNLVGRRLRARGLIDRRFGPQMEIGAPDALELIDDGRAVAPAGGAKG